VLKSPAAVGWATWQRSEPYTIGLEEEVMLLEPGAWSLAQRIDEVLPGLPESLAGRVSAETHQAAIELSTRPHAAVAPAIAELGELRARLAAALAGVGLRVAAAGTHPSALWIETRVAGAARYQLIHHTMRAIARREPTFALHVHVGVPDPDSAIRLMNRLRTHLPLLLALSANSPFWQARDTGLASARTPLFQAFPRTGMPRRYSSYEDWTESVDLLVRSRAIPEATFLWWDIRPQPSLGTVEVRVMDAQSTIERSSALCALLQATARLELEEGYASPALVRAEEALAENRFLAARDGVDARLIDADCARLRPVRALLDELMRAARPHADVLGCRDELEGVAALVEAPGAAHQRSVAERVGGLDGLVEELAGAFCSPARSGGAPAEAAPSS
jgi:glutamate---cysteine ligase / carboxylate-amine ligase